MTKTGIPESFSNYLRNTIEITKMIDTFRIPLLVCSTHSQKYREIDR